MKGMYRIALFAVLAGSAFAQTEPAPPPVKPPAEVERAVLERVHGFYDLMQQQKYRQGEDYIAEDTKDYYYAGSKPEVRKFEVISVEFSDLTHAKAMTKCTEPVVVAGFPPGEMNVVVPSLWKFENGNWYLYEDPNKIHNPGGVRSQIDAAIDAAVAGHPKVPVMGQDVAAAVKDMPKDPNYVLGKLHADKSEIKLSAGGSEKITITNGAPGPVSLELGYPLPGIEAKLDHTDLTNGDKAILTFTAGKQPYGGAYYLRVMPTGEALKIDVHVQ
jgi:hypothetical protein